MSSAPARPRARRRPPALSRAGAGATSGADADAGPLQIEQDSDRIPSAARVTSLSCSIQSLANLGRAVRSVDPDDVDAGVEQRGHFRGLVPGGTEGGDDLGAADRIAGHGTESNAGPSRPHHDLAADHGEAGRSGSRGVTGTALDGRSNAQATRSASWPGASVPRSTGAGRVRRAQRIGAHGLVEQSRSSGRQPPAGPPASLRRSSPRRSLRAGRAKRPARRSRRPSACGSAAGTRTRTRRGPRPPQWRSTSGMSVSRCAGCIETTSPAAAARSRSGWCDALEVLDPVRDRHARERRHQVERPPDRGVADGVHDRRDPRRGGGDMARPASSADVIGMPRSPLPS